MSRSSRTLTTKPFPTPPDIARYVVDWNVNLHRVVREVLQLSDGNPLKPSETLIFPRFHKGESLAPPNLSVVI